MVAWQANRRQLEAANPGYQLRTFNLSSSGDSLDVILSPPLTRRQAIRPHIQPQLYNQAQTNT